MEELEREVVSFAAKNEVVDAEVTFHYPDVVHLSKTDVIMVKVDLTRKGNPLHKRLVKHFEIKGVPSVVFIDPSKKGIINRLLKR